MQSRKLIALSITAKKNHVLFMRHRLHPNWCWWWCWAVRYAQVLNTILKDHHQSKWKWKLWRFYRFTVWQIPFTRFPISTSTQINDKKIKYTNNNNKMWSRSQSYHCLHIFMCLWILQSLIQIGRAAWQPHATTVSNR